MPAHPKDTALSEALRLDYSAPFSGVDLRLGGVVRSALTCATQQLTACVLVFGDAELPAGTYCVDCAGFLMRVRPQPLAHFDAEVAVLLGGPATASPAGLRELAVAAGVVSHHLTQRLAESFRQVSCDDDTIAWPLPVVHPPIAHLTTVTGKDRR